ncbi:hypothetical protein DFQ28_004517 [Apophysomyces sp. BC1034]|nr:hypothetical protein DFQ28_004517 [Apophysomyces sp. BC1034]
MGGAGSAVAETLAAHNKRVPLAQLGLPDMFIDHGDCAQQLASAGLDAAGIAASIRLAITDRLARPPAQGDIGADRSTRRLAGRNSCEACVASRRRCR